MSSRIVRIENGIVTQRIVLGLEKESLTAQESAQQLGLSGQWIDAKNSQGREYAVCDTWDEVAQDYIPATPFLGWIWSEQAQEHIAPIPAPGSNFEWNEEAQTWDPVIVFVDVNTATETELQALSGVGPATAGAIVLERNTNGLFTSLLNLSVRVDGVSAAMADGWTNAYVGESV